MAAPANARFWLFTLNNPEGLLDFDDFQGKVRYCIYSEEVGESGTSHFQGKSSLSIHVEKQTEGLFLTCCNNRVS